MLKIIMRKWSFPITVILLSVIAVAMIGCSGISYQRPPSIEDIVQRKQIETDAKNRQIVDDLQQGGYVIFLRHAKTDWSQKDIEPFNFNTCSGQRNLSEEGHAQAAKIGEA
jgi:hypothetical protein